MRAYLKKKPKTFVLLSNNDNHKYYDNNNACTNNHTDPDNPETDITSPDNAKTANR